MTFQNSCDLLRIKPFEAYDNFIYDILNKMFRHVLFKFMSIQTRCDIQNIKIWLDINRSRKR